MTLALGLSTLSFIYICTVLIVYITKPRMRILENRIYELLLGTAVLGLAINVISFYLDIFHEDLLFWRYFFTKGYHQYMLTFMWLMTLYIWFASFSKEKAEFYLNKKPLRFVLTSTLGYAFLTGINLALTFEFIHEGGNIYLQGPAMTFLYSLTAITLISWASFIAIKWKKLETRKYIPMIIFIIAIGLAFIIQILNPNLFLDTSLIAFTIVLMFFTIENPDMKMVGQLNKANATLEKAAKRIEKQRRIEQEQQEIIIQQSQLTTLGQVAGGMAHDVNSPIFAIKTGIHYLKKKGLIVKTEESDKVLNEIELSAAKITDLTTSVRNQIRNLTTKENVDFNVEDVIAEVKKVTNNNFVKNRSTLDVEIKDKIMLHGEKIKLHQAITNLVINALQAYKSNNKTGNVKVILRKEANDCIIEIIDEAGGIPPRIKDSLFKKMLTTKGAQGSGLGLFTTGALIKASFSGQIDVESEYGKGSTFIITIPIRKKEEITDEIELQNPNGR